MLHRLTALALPALCTILLAACGSTPEVEPTAPGKRPSRPPASGSTRPPPPLPAVYTLPQALPVLRKLIPARVAEADGWAQDIGQALGHLRIPLSPANLCSVLAIIEQESDFQADPPVPGLPALARREIEARRARYHVPELLLQKGLERRSADGRSYAERIDALRTESDLSRLYEEISASLPDIARRYQPRNPVSTAGAMQVNIAFAEEHLTSRPYPWGSPRSARQESFTRRGGLYFGIALLLDYEAAYPEPLYRFADYNAGRYASRNAAFQQALARLTGEALALDGDLLAYTDGQPATTPSHTQRTLERLGPSLGLSPGLIRSELLLEKTARFTGTRLWQRVFLMADTSTRDTLPRQIVPQIQVRSPKFQRTLHTSDYARRVDSRWQTCMNRQRIALASP